MLVSILQVRTKYSRRAFSEVSCSPRRLILAFFFFADNRKWCWGIVCQSPSPRVSWSRLYGSPFHLLPNSLPELHVKSMGMSGFASGTSGPINSGLSFLSALVLLGERRAELKQEDHAKSSVWKHEATGTGACACALQCLEVQWQPPGLCKTSAALQSAVFALHKQ